MNTKGLIKLLLSAVLVFWVTTTVNFSLLKGTLASIPLATVMLVVGGYSVGQLLSSVKWWTIARAGGITVSYPTVLKAYFIGMFVNCFGLGMVGGDVARGILVAQGLPKKTEGIASVVADRVHGLTVLSCIALLTGAFLGSDRVPTELVQLLGLLTVGFVAGWLIGPWVLTHIPFFKDTKLAIKMRQVAAIFPRDPKTLGIITALSVLFHTVQILLHGAMAVGVGAQIPWATLFIVIPLVNIVSSLPISWNGLGVREKSYIYFLTAAPAILSTEQAVAFGALWLMAVTITSAIGGIVALCSGDLKVLKAERNASVAAAAVLAQQG
jgi:uncharacterized membrane protein YbhN (UPF0104 family)